MKIMDYSPWFFQKSQWTIVHDFFEKVNKTMYYRDLVHDFFENLMKTMDYSP